MGLEGKGKVEIMDLVARILVRWYERSRLSDAFGVAQKENTARD